MDGWIPIYQWDRGHRGWAIFGHDPYVRYAHRNLRMKPTWCHILPLTVFIPGGGGEQFIFFLKVTKKWTEQDTADTSLLLSPKNKRNSINKNWKFMGTGILMSNWEFLLIKLGLRMRGLPNYEISNMWP